MAERNLAKGETPTEGEAMLRPAAREDLPALAALELLCFSDPWSEEGLGAHLSAESGETAVAVLGGRAVGYLAMTLIPPEAEVCRVAVDPACRRMGIGRRLLTNFFDRHPETESVFLEVRESNLAARGLYGALGFAAVGSRRRYYTNPTEDAVVMKWERGKDLADPCI